MNLTKFALKRQITTSMIYLAIVLGAIFAINRLPISLVPNLEYPRLRIVTYVGESTPDEVEQSITTQLVSAIKSVPGLNEIDSFSSSNHSEITLKLNRDADVRYLKFLVNEELNILRTTLPPNIQPQITEYIPTEFDETSFMQISFSGKYSHDELNELLTRYLVNPISALDDVSNCTIAGASRTEYDLKISPEMLDFVDIPDIIRLLNSYGSKIIAGSLKNSDSSLKVMLNGSYATIESIMELETTLTGGQKRKLKSILTLEENSKVTTLVYRYNFEPRLLLTVEKKSQANVLRLSTKVKALIEAQRHFLPAELSIEIVEDEAEKVRDEMNILYHRSAIALLIIFLVLLVFLKKLYSTITILVSIIFSVLLTLIMLYSFGVGLNIISFAGLTMGLGLMVDNAIVVYENIHRHKRLNPNCSIIDATREVTLPIVSSTITTIIVFAPFIFLQGDLKIFYLPFVYATVISILSSLLVSFTLIPLIASKLTFTAESKQSSSFKLYQRGLNQLIRFRWLVILLLAVLIFFSWKTYNKHLKSGWTFDNRVDKNVYLALNLSTGTNLKLLEEVFLEFEQLLLPYRQGIIFDGFYTASYARLKFTTNNSLEHPVDIIMLRDLVISLGMKFANVDLSVWGFGDNLSIRTSTSTNNLLTLKGYNYRELYEQALEVETYLKKLSKRFYDFKLPYDLHYSADIKSYEVKFERELLNSKGIALHEAVSSLYSQMNRVNNSLTSSVGSREITINIEPDFYLTFAELQNTLINKSVRLKDVSSVKILETAGRINNSDNAYLLNLNYGFKGDNTIHNRLLDNVYTNYKLPVGYSFVKPDSFTKRDEEKEEQQTIWKLIIFSILLVYMSLCALLESFKYPFVILLTVPLALIGVVWIYYLFDQHIDSSALMGIVLLAGIVVNNSIILVSHISTLRLHQLPLKTAVIQGTTDRIRPILMTSLTTILGLVPMLFVSASSQSQLWKLLSLSTIGGLFAATIFTLTIIPVFYYVISKKE